MLPYRRSKRAAAVIAEDKIREVVQEINRDDEVVTKKQRQDPSTGPRIHDGGRPSDKRRNTSFQASDRDAKPVLWGSRLSSNQDPALNEGEGLMIPNQIESFSSSIETSLQAVIDDEHAFFAFDSSVHSSAAKARLAHQRRRSARQVNSSKRMVFSRRTSYRMSLGSIGSPEYSPIAASRLSFTPIAKLPKSPALSVHPGMRPDRT